MAREVIVKYEGAIRYGRSQEPINRCLVYIERVVVDNNIQDWKLYLQSIVPESQWASSKVRPSGLIRGTRYSYGGLVKD